MGDGRVRGAGRVDGVDVHGMVAMVAGCRHVATMVAGCQGLRAEDAPAEVVARRRWRWHRWCDDDGDDDHGDDDGGAVDGDGDEMVVMMVGGGGVGDGEERGGLSATVSSTHELQRYYPLIIFKELERTKKICYHCLDPIPPTEGGHEKDTSSSVLYINQI